MPISKKPAPEPPAGDQAMLAAINELIKVHNKMLESHNTLVNTIDRLITSHNAIAERLEALEATDHSCAWECHEAVAVWNDLHDIETRTRQLIPN